MELSTVFKFDFYTVKTKQPRRSRAAQESIVMNFTLTTYRWRAGWGRDRQADA